MSRKKSSSLALIGLVTINLLLSACSSSSGASDNSPATPPPNPSPAAIEGVATPSSVAVVTATNAN